MKKILFILSIATLTVPAHAGWIATFAAMDAADKADKAKQSAEATNQKLDTLIELLKQDHDRIDKLEKSVDDLTPKKKPLKKGS